MCVLLPQILAGVSLAVKVGSAISDNKAQKKQSKATKKAALRAQKLERNAISIRQIEEGAASSRRLRDLRLVADQQEGSIAASAGGAGVVGNAVTALMGDLEGSVGRATVDILDSYTATLSQLDRAKEGADARKDARIAGAPGPSLLATGIRIGGSVTNSLSQFATLREARRAAGG